jgi:hypothetical protein
MSACKGALVVALAMAGIGAATACTKIPTDDNAVLSLALDSLPAPAVVRGDTLRDSTGRAVPLNATVYNFQGSVISNAPLRFHALDRGVTVDSVTGFAFGDSVRQTPARILISIGSLQAIRTLDVTLRPDTVSAVNGRDSLLYSLTDTTKNFSPALSVKVVHSLTADSVVKSYIVGFAVVSSADTLLATLVNESGKASRIDTTDASGIASRRIRLNPARLTALTDSIIVNASVKYRGAHIRGSPVRLVLKVKQGAS